MVIAIVPAFNEEKTIGEVVQSLRPFVDKVIVIDDGSYDLTAKRAREAGAEVLAHLLNRGQGAALETGRQAALKSNADIIITFDADGQFNAEEIPALILPIKAGECDVVLGSRFLPSSRGGVEGLSVGGRTSPSLTLGGFTSSGGETSGGPTSPSLNPSFSEREAGRDLVSKNKKSNIPPLRRLLLQLAVIFTRLTTGLKITDTHNGLRAFSRFAAERINVTQDRMAHASEILEKISRLGLKYKEVPVTVKYTEYSLGKGQKPGDFIKILKDLFWGKII